MQKLLTLGVTALVFITTSFTASAAEKDYMVIDLKKEADAAKYPVSYLSAVPEGGWNEEYKTSKLVLRRIEPGKFMMGSDKDDPNKSYDEKQHEVTLTKPFYIGVFEMTKRQADIIKNGITENPKGDLTPELVSRDDTVAFIEKLQSGTGETIVLPTEAQWEYAARGGKETQGFTYSGSNTFDEIGWGYENAGDEKLDETLWDKTPWAEVYKTLKANNNRLHEVGTKKANELGLYDMSGNTWEWCSDGYIKDFSTESVTDPKGEENSEKRIGVSRGGALAFNAKKCRPASRRSGPAHGRHSDIGFRIIVVVSEK